MAGAAAVIPLVYVVITLLTVQRSAYGATEAARAAGRAYVLAPDVATARERAYDAARVALQRPRRRARSRQLSRSAAGRRRSRVCSPARRSRCRSASTSSSRWCRRSTAIRRRRSRSMRRTERPTASTGRPPDESRRASTEAGQLTVLIVAFALCLLLAVAAVTDISASYLRRQSMASLADGAALSATDGAAAAAVYGDPDAACVALDESAARAAVDATCARSTRYRTFPGLRAESTWSTTSSSVRLQLDYRAAVPDPRRETNHDRSHRLRNHADLLTLSLPRSGPRRLVSP